VCDIDRRRDHADGKCRTNPKLQPADVDIVRPGETIQYSACCLKAALNAFGPSGSYSVQWNFTSIGCP
jgi:hypothetical protein